MFGIFIVCPVPKRVNRLYPQHYLGNVVAYTTISLFLKLAAISLLTSSCDHDVFLNFFRQIGLGSKPFIPRHFIAAVPYLFH